MAVPGVETDQVVQRFFLTLDKTQRQSAASIWRYQQHLLERLVRHAVKHVPFYRDTRRLEPLFGPSGEFRIDALEEVPVLTRAEAHDNQATLHADHVPAEMRPLQEDRTSGTTGTPLAIRRTALARVAAKALFGRALTWHDRADVGTIAVTSTTGLFSGAVPTETGSTDRETGSTDRGAGAPFMVPVDIALEDQLSMLRGGRPSHIIGYPNQILNWLHSDERRAFENVRCVVTTGEVLHPATKQEIRSALGATVIDAYSTNETGPIAFAGKTGGFRIAEENIYLENDERTTGLQPVTVTPFYSYGTPLIRYRPGDYVENVRPGRGSTCGLRRFHKVVGRERNLLVRRDGSRFWPNMAAKLMTQVLDYGDWQVVQHEAGSAEMSIVVTPETPPEKLDELRAVLVREVFGDMDLTIRPVERLETGLETGKSFQLVVSYTKGPDH